MSTAGEHGVLVSFDFGGTLDGSGLAPCAQRWEYYARAGHRFDSGRLRAANSAARDRLLADPGAARWTLAERVERWFTAETRELGLRDPRLPEWIESFVRAETHGLAAAAGPLAELARHYRLAVVSNNLGNVERVLAETGLLGYFAVVTDSAVCGHRKPDPEIFRHCQRRAGVTDPGRCWHLGDSPAKDVRAARAAGWNAVLFATERSPSDTVDGVTPVASSLAGYGALVGHALSIGRRM